VTNDTMNQEVEEFRNIIHNVISEVGKVIVGQKRVIESTLTALICGGNVLLEGVPGLGKTELVKAISRVMDLNYNRIQFTPDLMPADIIGTNIMETREDGTYSIEFKKGPIFTQLLLADEINRATPKTQSAMLESMQEGSVTVGGNLYKMKQPFFVLATQNPLEQEGTFPLPEAQLDRFMFKIDVGFLNREELNDMVSRTILKTNIEVNKIIDSEGILRLRDVLEKVVVADPIRDYAVRMVLATHPDNEFAPEEIKRFVRWGASPRAIQALIRASRLRALTEGRAHVAVDDINHFANEVLRHRVLLNYDGQAENILVTDLISKINLQAQAAQA